MDRRLQPTIRMEGCGAWLVAALGDGSWILLFHFVAGLGSMQPRLAAAAAAFSVAGNPWVPSRSPHSKDGSKPMHVCVANRRWCRRLCQNLVIRVLCHFGLVLVAGGALLGQSYGQQPHPDQHEKLRSLEQECGQNVERVKAALATERESGSPISNYLSRELALWQQLEMVVARRLAADDDRGSLQPAAGGPTAAAAGFAAPNTFLELDETREFLETTQRSLESVTLELESAKVVSLDTRRRLEEVEQLLRRCSVDSSGVA